MIKSHDPEAAATIELTPIIDMVFLLLIFFLVATTFHQTEREMKIALPVSSSAGPISAAMREIIINVRDDGQIIVSGHSVEPDDLKAMIQQALALNPEQKVTVRGDRNVAYGHIALVLDICKGSGVSEPYLDSIPIDAG